MIRGRRHEQVRRGKATLRKKNLKRRRRRRHCRRQTHSQHGNVIQSRRKARRRCCGWPESSCSFLFPSFFLVFQLGFITEYNFLFPVSLALSAFALCRLIGQSIIICNYFLFFFILRVSFRHFAAFGWKPLSDRKKTQIGEQMALPLIYTRHAQIRS